MKISILTATYNSEKTLRDTIESVLRQSCRDFEYILIDGGSKDNTVDIIKEYEPKFEGRLRYVSEPDNGIYDAMNKGIRMATGDVVGILNSDDFYTSDDALQKIADAFEHNDIDATYGDIHFVNDDDLTKMVRYYSSAVFKRSFMRFGLMPAHPSFYCKREVYEKYGAFDISYRIAADFENLLRLIFIYRIKTLYIPKDFVTMRTGGASTAGFDSRKKIMHEHLRAMKKNGVYSNFFLLSLRYFYKIYELMRGGRHQVL
jgi:glycosyltransferase involved in cell wall biosynthesis